MAAVDDDGTTSASGAGSDGRVSSTDAQTDASATSTAASAPPPETIAERYASTLRVIDTLTSVFGFPRGMAEEAVAECGPEDAAVCYNYILDRHPEIDDGGGPVVPRADCPHLERWCATPALAAAGGERRSGIFGAECQHREAVGAACGAAAAGGRKRLRSEDEKEKERGVGRAKDEADYVCGGGSEEQGSGVGEGIGGLGCPNPHENWMCLTCESVLCSRYSNGHAKAHWERTKRDEEEADAKSTAASGHCVAISLADLSTWCYECRAYLTHPRLDALTKELGRLKFGECDEETGGGDGDGGGNAAGGGHAAATANVRAAGATTEESAEDRPRAELAEIRGDDEASDGSRAPPEETAFLLSGRTGTAVRSRVAGSSSNETEEDGRDECDRENDDDDESNDESNDDDDENDESDDDARSDSGQDSYCAAMISSLLQLERAGVVRAYLDKTAGREYEGGAAAAVPPPVFSAPPKFAALPQAGSPLPKPPSFPGEMADFLTSPLCRSVVVLSGAGMSVSSGIPDFRSAGSGMYDTLRPELLTATEIERELMRDDPTLTLDREMFLQNPLPCLELKRSFILGTHEGRWRATLAHRFVELIHSKLGKLTRWYTQNIDGLEGRCTKLPPEKVVAVHGSMGRAACEACGASADFDEFCDDVRRSIKDISAGGGDENGDGGRGGEDDVPPTAPSDITPPLESTPIFCRSCGGPTVKPTIVLFRGSLPREFHVRCAEDLPGCDLLIVIGTSLTVAPANTLVWRVPPAALRLVVNDEPVGARAGVRYGEGAVRDVFARGRSDAVFLDWAERLGWLDDLAESMDHLPEGSAAMLRERIDSRNGNGAGDGGG